MLRVFLLDGNGKIDNYTLIYLPALVKYNVVIPETFEKSSSPYKRMKILDRIHAYMKLQTLSDGRLLFRNLTTLFFDSSVIQKPSLFLSKAKNYFYKSLLGKQHARKILLECAKAILNLSDVPTACRVEKHDEDLVGCA